MDIEIPNEAKYEKKKVKYITIAIETEETTSKQASLEQKTTSKKRK